MRDFKNLDQDDVYELNYRIENISDLIIQNEDDYLFLRRQLRHILEVVLTNEEFNRLYGVKEKSDGI